jgi:hypothetical protein
LNSRAKLMFSTVCSSAQRPIASIAPIAPAFVPCSEKNTLRSSSNSSCGPEPGSPSQRASRRRPFAVIEYTVRGRCPVNSLDAFARPNATRRFGSS